MRFQVPEYGGIDKLPEYLRQVAYLLCVDHRTNKVLAHDLDLSHTTMKIYSSLIYQLLGIKEGQRELILRYWEDRLDASQAELDAALAEVAELKKAAELSQLTCQRP